MEKIKDCLEGLDYLEEKRSCSAYVKDQIKTLKIDLKFLRTFLVCEEAFSFKGSVLIKGLRKKTEAVIQDVESVILRLKDGQVSIDFEGDQLSSLRRKIGLIKVEIHRYYQRNSLLRADVREEVDVMVNLVECALENLKDLLEAEVNSIVGLKKIINALNRKLRFLRSSLQFVDKLKILDYKSWQLFSEVSFAAVEAASFFLRCWVNKNEPQRDPGFSLMLKYRKHKEETSIYSCMSGALNSDASDALLLAFIDFLLQQLTEVLSHENASLETPTRDQLEGLHRALELLRSLFTTASTQHADHEKSYRQLLKIEANLLCHLVEDFCIGKTNDAISLRLLGRLKFINLTWIMERVNHEVSLISPTKDQFEIFCEDMPLLRNFIIDTQRDGIVDNKFNDIHGNIEAMALKAGSLVYSFNVNEIKADMVEEMSHLLPDLLEMIELFKADMRKIYTPASSFPEAGDQSRLIFFLEQLSNLLKDFGGGAILHFVKPHMRRDVELQIENALGEVQILKLFLDNFEEPCIERGERKALEKHVINLINGVKFVINPSFPGIYLVSYCMLKHSDVLEEVPLIKKEMARINDKIFYEIDFLLEHMAEQLSSDGFLKISKIRFESLRNELKLVSCSLARTAMPQHVGAQLKEVALLIEDLYVGNMNETIITTDKAILLRFLGRLKLMSLFCIIEQVDHETSLTPQGQLETLCKHMQLLRNFYSETQKYYDEDEKFNDINSHIEALALEERSAIYSLNINDIVPHLLEKVKLIKADMRKIYPCSNLPNIRDRRGPPVFLKELSELLIRRSSQTIKSTVEKDAKACIENVQNGLQFLISFLENSKEQHLEIGEVEALEKRIMNMANEAKYATDPIFLRERSEWYCKLELFEVMEEVRLIKEEVERVNAKISSEILSSQDDTLIMGEVIVGFEDEDVKMTEQLTGGPKQLNVTSIVGMGGLGKTTLAKKLYENPSVVRHFYVRAWCCISQAFQKRQVLLDILGQVVELTERTDDKTDKDLEAMLYKSLKEQRYLIVMDDVWDIEAWTAVRRCFPDDHMGSRIIFTTRLQEVALKVQARSSICHNLRFFDDNESQELLRKKLFPGGRCPPEQVGIVERIAKNCKGLPLAVVLMAGILARKKKEEWQQVAKSLSRHADGDLQNLSMKLLEYSYQNLPHHLRRCFLYLGAFPEDKEIPVKKLTWLWIAEGFIQKNEQKILEDIAKDYLMDLIGSSLVMIAARGSSGGVKACRIHDVSRSFTLAKAEEEKFLLLLDRNQQVDGQVGSFNSYPITCPEYRLSIYSMLSDLVKWPSSSHVCSLLHFASAFLLDVTSPYDASFIFTSFKCLTVLDLGLLLLKDLDNKIESLVYLRFLALRIQSNSIPSSISTLKNLEIFLVRGTRGEVALPNTIWRMVSLRHLHIDKRASSIWDKKDIEDAILDKLETLSTPVLQCDTNSRDLAISLPNLRKLKCIFTASWSNIDNCNYFPDLGSLHRLESLKVFYYATNASHGRFSFPKNLKKLTLSMFRLPWSDITPIGKALPNLEVLKLQSRAFGGKQWETGEGEFPRLKYLKLESLDIEEWYVPSEDHFPLLEKLVVHRCKQLKEIPSSFGDINTLELIEVKWCNQSTANLAKGICKEKQEYGNEGFKVVIHPHPTDSGPASSS